MLRIDADPLENPTCWRVEYDFGASPQLLHAIANDIAMTHMIAGLSIARYEMSQA